MNRPKRKCTMARIDESNSAPTSSKHHRQDKSNESSDIAGGSKISTEQSGTIEKSRPFPIEDLTTELLVKIIEFLPVSQWSPLERVHPNIRDVVYTAWGSLKKIDIQRDFLPRQRAKLDGVKKFQDKRIAIVEKLCKRAPNLIDIAVGCSEIETYRGLRFIMDQLVEFEKLQRIDFGKDCLTTSTLSRFLRESASRDQLKEIVNVDASIRQMYFDNNELSVAFDNSINNDKYLRLETMDFERVDFIKRIPWNFFAMVDVSRLTTFRAMNIAGNVHMDIAQRILADFLDRTPQLRQLSFQFGCCYMQGASPHQPPANETVLESNKRIISAIARMDGLESLIMGSRIYNPSTCSCEDFGQQLMELLTMLGQRPSFKELGLVGHLTKLAFMTSVAPAIPNLESLRLEMSSLTTPILDAIFLPRSGLRKLHVSACCDSVGANQFNIKYIMQNAPTLESLILDIPLKRFSDDILKELGGLTKLRELKLRMSVGHSIDSSVVKSWADGFGENLVELEINDFDGSSLSNEILVKLVKTLPNLKKFIIKNRPITDVTLKQIAALSPKIEEFGFDCDNITKVGLQHVVDGFRHLKKFILKRFDWRLKKNFNLDYGKYRVVNISDS